MINIFYNIYPNAPLSEVFYQNSLAFSGATGMNG